MALGADAGDAEEYADNNKDPDSPDPDDLDPVSDTCADCDNSVCTETVNIALRSVPYVRISGVSDDSDNSSLSDTAPTEIKQGRKVTVTAVDLAPAVKKFVCWDAPGLLIHGSPKKRETFVASGNTTVSAYAEPAGTYTAAFTHLLNTDDIEYTVSGKNASIEDYLSPSGQKIGIKITAEYGETVDVSYKLKGERAGREFENGWKGRTAQNMGTSNTTITLLDAHSLLHLVPNTSNRAFFDEFDMAPMYSYSATSGIGDPTVKRGGMTSELPGILTQLRLPAEMDVRSGVANIPKGFDWVGVKVIESENGVKTFHHMVDAMFTLTLPPTACQGFAAADPPSKFYDPPDRDENGKVVGDCEVVCVYAHSLPGYGFAGWAGGAGVAYLTSQVLGTPLDGYEIRTDGNGHEVSGYGFTSAEIQGSSVIYVKMDGSKTITAKFAEPQKPAVKAILSEIADRRVYGTEVTVIFENAAGWVVNEQVFHLYDKECDCYSETSNTVQNTFFQELIPCDWNGISPGPHGCIVDSIECPNPCEVWNLSSFNPPKLPLECNTKHAQIIQIGQKLSGSGRWGVGSNRCISSC